MACHHEWRDCEVGRYVRCAECGTYHSPTAPAPETIYTAGYWDGINRSTLRDQVYNILEYRECGVSKAEYLKASIRTPGRAAALEIGCAPGAILKTLREDVGFEIVAGVDVCEAWWPDIFDIAGGPCAHWTGLFPDALPQRLAARFDIIVALDVFEHSPEPERFLSACARLLKPQGQLFLMMPLAREHRRVEPRMFQPAEHVFIHSERNLLGMLEEAGFTGYRLGRWAPGHESVSAAKRRSE